MRYLLLLALLLGGCGGGSSPGVGTPANSAGTAPASNKGIAVSVRVKQVANRVSLRGEEIVQVVLDVVDPLTLQSAIPATIVRRDPGQVSQSVRLEVPPGRWLLRIQGRTADGQAAGTRFEDLVPVTAAEVTSVVAELNPLTDLTGLQITPGPQFRLAPNTSLQLTATGIRSDLTSENVTNNVIWSSSAASVANVSSTGLVTATGLGTAVLTARSGDLSANTTVTVSQIRLTQLQVTPSSLVLATGMTRPLTATGIFSDNTSQDLTTQVVWTSSDFARASVSATGVVTGGAPGNATITALQGEITASATVSVQAALVRLDVQPADARLPVGKAQALKATGFFSDGTSQDLTASVTWASSVPTVASVDAAGLVLARAPGTADVTATSGNVSAVSRITATVAELASITVTPTGVRLPKGAARPFRASGTFTDGSTRDLTETATWTSTNPSVLVVSNANGTRGQATAGNLGTAFVEASQDALTGAAAVNVTAAELVALHLRPENPVATALFAMLQFQVVGRYTDATEVDLTNVATWTSSKPEVATISNVPGSQGLATVRGGGITAIQVASGNVSNATALRVDLPPPPPAPTPLGRVFGTDTVANRVVSFVASEGPGTVVTNITGAATNLNGPTDISVDRVRDLIYVANKNDNKVLVWPLSATGNVAPSRFILGSFSTNPLLIDSVNNRLYVQTTASGESINIYDNADTLTGTPPVNRTITNFGQFVRGIALDAANDRLFVTTADNALSKICIFDNISTKSGTLSATVSRTVTGPNTSLNHSHDIVLDPRLQRLYVTNFGNSSVVVFDNAATMNGNVAPTQILTGPATQLPPNPNGITADFGRVQLYISNTNLLIYPTTATGNTPPTRTLPVSTGYVDFDPRL